MNQQAALREAVVLLVRHAELLEACRQEGGKEREGEQIGVQGHDLS